MGARRSGTGMVPAHSLALPTGVDPRQRWDRTAQAHESFLTSATIPGWLRPVVRDSWQRSAALRVDPDVPAPPVDLTDDDLDETRRAHVLRAAIPVIRRLLVDHASDAGVIVAVGDEHARLLWVDGDPHLRRQAESIHVVDGATWNEQSAGTNAMGTAQETGELVQIFGSEHFTRTVHPWSCTAAPIRDPHTGRICGFLDITGRDDVASPQSAMLIRSATAAVEAELRLRHAAVPAPQQLVYLRTLGRERGELTIDGRGHDLSLRHTELLVLLSIHPDGISAGELAWKMYEHEAAEVTVRAEVSRLRKAWPMLIAPSRPYRLLARLQTDAADVAECLQRGAHRRAQDLYLGPLLPRSEAPGIVEHRNHLHGWLRQALLRHASADVLMRYARSAAGRDDVELWQACLQRLPYGSHRRAEVTAAVQSLHDTLGASDDCHATGLQRHRP